MGVPSQRGTVRSLPQVSEPGCEPELTAEEHEDMRLIGPLFADAAGA